MPTLPQGRWCEQGQHSPAAGEAPQGSRRACILRCGSPPPPPPPPCLTQPLTAPHQVLHCASWVPLDISSFGEQRFSPTQILFYYFCYYPRFLSCEFQIFPAMRPALTVSMHVHPGFQSRGSPGAKLFSGNKLPARLPTTPGGGGSLGKVEARSEPKCSSQQKKSGVNGVKE